MTDHELLDLAAKAAGLIVVGWVEDYDVTPGHCLYGLGGPVIGDPVFGKTAVYMGTPWNPLLDDGDALRLAVKLKIMIDPEFAFPADEFGFVDKVMAVWLPGETGNPSFTGYGGDKMGTLRQLVVRAAAEIGKKIGQPS